MCSVLIAVRKASVAFHSLHVCASKTVIHSCLHAISCQEGLLRTNILGPAWTCVFVCECVLGPVDDEGNALLGGAQQFTADWLEIFHVIDTHSWLADIVCVCR